MGDKAPETCSVAVTSAVIPGNASRTAEVDAFYISHFTGEPIYLGRGRKPEHARRTPGAGGRAGTATARA